MNAHEARPFSGFGQWSVAFLFRVFGDFVLAIDRLFLLALLRWRLLDGATTIGVIAIDILFSHVHLRRCLVAI